MGYPAAAPHSEKRVVVGDLSVSEDEKRQRAFRGGGRGGVGGVEGRRQRESTRKGVQLGHVPHRPATGCTRPPRACQTARPPGHTNLGDGFRHLCARPLPQSPRAWQTELNTTSSKRVFGKNAAAFTTSTLNAKHRGTRFLRPPRVTAPWPCFPEGSWRSMTRFHGAFRRDRETISVRVRGALTWSRSPGSGYIPS